VMYAKHEVCKMLEIQVAESLNNYHSTALHTVHVEQEAIFVLPKKSSNLNN